MPLRVWMRLQPTARCINKSGYYLAALAAREYHVPFYFISDTLKKLDTSTLLGLSFQSEPIQYHEVLGSKTYEAGVRVVGKLFDVTPPQLITGIVSSSDLFHPGACIQVMWNMKLSKRISELIPAWAHNKL